MNFPLSKLPYLDIPAWGRYYETLESPGLGQIPAGETDGAGAGIGPGRMSEVLSMAKRILGLLLALLLAMSCLSGCASQEDQAFYDTAEAMAATEDAQIEAELAYHGAKLVISGFICRSAQTMDLTFQIKGTDESNGTWTELKVDGNQVWLNVGKLAERTLSFDLSELRQGDIEDLQNEQTSEWVSYTWQGEFWDGIPGWGELLSQLWEDCKSDLNGHITEADGSYTLELTGSTLLKAQRNLLNSLVSDSDSYLEGFTTWAETEGDLLESTQLTASQFFENYWTWSTLLSELEADNSSDSSLTVTLAESDGSYSLTASDQDGEQWSLTVTPTEAQSVTAPDDAMEFGYYADCLYYLADFSITYINDALDGVENEADSAMAELFDDETASEPSVTDMETGAAVGFSDLATIEFVPDGGSARTVPILTSYQSNSVTTDAEDSSKITDLSLYGTGWYQTVYTEANDGRESSVYLEQSINTYYEAYIDISGYLLAQDISEQVSGSSGALAQGFAYREDDYSNTMVQLLVVLPPEGDEGYTVLDFQLELEEMSAADLQSVEHLFTYLGLELPLDLEV